MSFKSNRITACSLAVFIAVTLSACGKNEYPPSAVSTFMNSCIQNGGDVKGCSCTLEKVQKKWTYEELQKITANDTAELNKISELAKSCQ